MAPGRVPRVGEIPARLSLKLLLIGDSAVGKSSLLLRFVGDSFNPAFISTIGVDFRPRTVDIDGEQVKLSVWDTAGQERFRTITAAYYRGANGIALVYDVTSEASFNSIRGWMRNLEERASANVSKILVGNKADMEERRVVSKQQGQALAKEFNIRFFETSAKADVNVEEAFLCLARESLRRAAPPPLHKDQPMALQFPKADSAAQNSQPCCNQ